METLEKHYGWLLAGLWSWHLEPKEMIWERKKERWRTVQRNPNTPGGGKSADERRPEREMPRQEGAGGGRSGPLAQGEKARDLGTQSLGRRDAHGSTPSLLQVSLWKKT